MPLNNLKTQNLTSAVEAPLSAAQAGIFFRHSLDPTGCCCNIAEYFEIDGEIEPHVFEVALKQTIEEIEGLRQRFVVTAAGPRAIIGDLPEKFFYFMDFSSSSDPSAIAREWMHRDLSKPVDLQSGQLCCFALIRIANTQYLYYQRCHHIALDALGGSLLARRVSAIYRGLKNCERTEADMLAPCSILLEEETVYRRSNRFSRDREFWLSLLRERRELTSLSIRQERASHEFHRATAFVSHSVFERIGRIASELRVDIPNVFAAAVAVYVYRMTGDEDLILGLPMSGRPRASTRKVAGLASNIVPLRVSLCPEQSLSELLIAVASRMRSAARHQLYRYEDLRRDLGISPNDRGLFGVTINCIREGDDLWLGGKPAVRHNLTNGPVDDICFVLYDQGNESFLRIVVDANTALYSAEDAEAHLRRIVRLIDCWAEDPRTTVGSIDFLEAEERLLVVEGWNETSAPVEVTTLPALFEAQVARTPNAPAVQSSAAQGCDETMTYWELNRRANRLARALIARNVGPEHVVGLALPRSSEIIVAMLGILKSGAAYLPLDLDYPPARLSFMIEDSQPSCIVTTADAADALQNAGAPLLLLGDLIAAPVDAISPEAAELVRPLSPRDPAYVIYTSGSTGRPKGVIVEHSQLVNIYSWYIERCPTMRGGVNCLAAPLSFDLAQKNALAPLLCGGAIRIASPRSSGHALSAAIGEGVAVLNCAPSQVYPLAEHISSSRNVPKIDYLVLGGEPISWANLAPWLECAAHTELVNSYGPTECADVAVAVAEPVEARDVSLVIGTPIWNTRIYILDSALQPTPIGSPGELYIAGSGVGRGYLHRPGQTAERFVADPYGTPGTRMYRTGDLARWRTDGRIEFLGRVDHQVKIRGFRIELGEIEAALEVFPGVERAAVMAIADANGQKRLVGYFSVERGLSIEPTVLRRKLSASLPEHMVPSTIVLVDSWPLTPSGKLDRKRLPVPSVSMSSKSRAPSTETEKRLVAIFKDVLALEHVGIDDSFYDLGGHSLAAARLLDRIHSDFGYDLSFRTLLEAPSVAELASRLVTEGDENNTFDVILPLRRTPANCPPLFCIHPAAGLSWCYTGLLRYVPVSQRVYGLQSRALTMRAAAASSFDLMIEDYASLIRSIQPVGPYHLLGWSFGGTAAFALATRFQSEGDDVGLLAMLDSYPHATRFGDFEQDSMLESVFSFLNLTSDKSGDNSTSLVDRVIYTFRSNLKLIDGFSPEPFSGDVFFVAADNRSFGRNLRAPSPIDDWGPFVTGKMFVHNCSAHHYALLHPKALAEFGPILTQKLATLTALQEGIDHAKSLRQERQHVLCPDE